MKFLLVCTFAAAGLLSAQVVSGRAAGGVVFTSPGGFGNVAFPGTGRPQVPSAIGLRQLPLRNGNRNGFRGNSSIGFPVIVGGGFYGGGSDGYGDQSGYGQQLQQPSITIINNPPAQLAPTVVINQNYGGPAMPDPNGDATTHIFQPAPRQDASLDNTAAQAPHYFLIAFKDHSVYSALAYWVEDKTMHYVTPQQTHNQASLDLIDMDLTKQLNQR